MEVKIKLNGGLMPQKQHEGDAAFDLYVPEDVELFPGRQKVDMGFALELPKGKAAIILPRSGCSLKGIEVWNKVTGQVRYIDADVKIGLVDSNYRKNVGTILQVREFPFGSGWILRKGSRISQMRIVDVPEIELIEATELSVTERDGGFGTTGQ